MKPLGIRMEMRNGVPGLAVSPSDHVADKVWEAVQEAILAGWTVDQFKSEAAEAWQHELRKAAKHAASDWRKP